MNRFVQRCGEKIFRVVALWAILLSLGVLCALLVDLLLDGVPRLSWNFFSSFPSRFPDKSGILAALVGSVALVTLTAIFAFPIGIGAAVYLEEYAPPSRLSRILELNIANLAGVPSIIYGILGLEVFVRWMMLDRSLIAGALTMGLLALPIIIISSREALKQVPESLRVASLALGASRWQTIWYQVLPVAMPGIMTGCIFALSRVMGETAPLVAVGALTYVAFLPSSPFSEFSTLPIQAFNWISRPQEAFHQNAAAAIIVLLVILLMMNSVAMWIRARYQIRLK